MLSALTGSPLLAGAIVVAAWLLLDRVTLGLLPDPVRFFRRWQRIGKLRDRVAAAPFDRKARAELAELYLDAGRNEAAYQVVLPNHQAGEDDIYTLFALGCAAYRSGRVEEAEALLAQAWAKEAKFRLGAIPLELGRGRLAAGKHEGAEAALLHLLEFRPSSVEGKVLLARCRVALGKKREAEQLYDEAWADHQAAPRFQQRQQRWWAWRAKPERPILYVIVTVMVLLAVRSFVPWGSFHVPKATYDTIDYDE